MNIFWLIINITLRAAVALVGIVLIVIADEFYVADVTLIRTAGVVFILFGIFRMVTFYSNFKKYQREQEREER